MRLRQSRRTIFLFPPRAFDGDDILWSHLQTKNGILTIAHKNKYCQHIFEQDQTSQKTKTHKEHVVNKSLKYVFVDISDNFDCDHIIIAHQDKSLRFAHSTTGSLQNVILLHPIYRNNLFHLCIKKERDNLLNQYSSLCKMRASNDM